MNSCLSWQKIENISCNMFLYAYGFHSPREIPTWPNTLYCLNSWPFLPGTSLLYFVMTKFVQHVQITERVTCSVDIHPKKVNLISYSHLTLAPYKCRREGIGWTSSLVITVLPPPLNTMIFSLIMNVRGVNWVNLLIMIILL